MRIKNEIKNLHNLEIEIPQMETDKEGKIRGGFAAMAMVDEEAYGTNISCNIMCNFQCKDGCNSDCNIMCNMGCNGGCNEKCNPKCNHGCNIDCTSQPTDKPTDEKNAVGVASLFPTSFYLLF